MGRLANSIAGVRAMRKARAIRVVAVLLILALIGTFVFFATLPLPPKAPRPVAVPAAEHARSVAALKPPKRARPVIAVVGINDATETTDYLMPMSILRRSGVADVWALATEPGPVQLYPALKVQPDATTADFDRRFPSGADYVIVPAMSRDDDPAVLAWIQRQASRGAVIIGVCAGARVVANTGLLDGRGGTTHWYFLKGLRKAHPEVRYVKDRRFVVDGPVATTTGITASLPMSLTLIEAIAGPARAADVGRTLGLADWDAGHDSDAFRFNRRFALTVLGNILQPWRKETLGISLSREQDGVALALAADAWSRTYRSRVESYAPTPAPVRTREGVLIVPDRAGLPPAGRSLPHRDGPAAVGLDQTLAAIADRYDGATAEVVAMQLEYPAAGLSTRRRGG